MISAHFPHLVETVAEPLVWIERAPRPDPRRDWSGDMIDMRVTFDWYTPRAETVWAGLLLQSIGTPTLWGMSRAAVAELLDGTTRRPCLRGCGRPATVEWKPAHAGDPAQWMCAACALATEADDGEGDDEAQSSFFSKQPRAARLPRPAASV